MKQIQRDGYWAIQWSEDACQSLADLIRVAPELVYGKRVAITSCDSGPYRPSLDEVNAGWSLVGSTAISKEIEEPLELPAVGFDEWYVFDETPNVVPTQNYVNHYDFSLLDESDVTRSFWTQIKETTPLHVLGDGAPNLFVVTRDRAIFDLVQNFIIKE
ncbi:hypothetical protein RugamoR57_09820 [Duganella caerulea]|uniref:hypothetical protein n=1 Tax=Duganella caerulea TaxID=2885762 RepID=UPI0030E9383A